MTAVDSYLAEAIDVARDLAATDGNLELAEETLVQGQNNRVLPATYGGVPAVLKYYGDGFRPNLPGELRQRREATFLRHAASTGLVPELLAEYRRVLVLRRLAGEGLQRLLDRRGKRSASADTARDLGAAHRALLGLHLQDDALREMTAQCAEASDPRAEVEGLMARAQECLADGPYGDPERQSLMAITEALPEVLDGPRVLYKYDNNLRNVIVAPDGRVQGLIDFEQWHIGTAAMYVGALYDCAHGTPWGRRGECVIFEKIPWRAYAEGIGPAVHSSSARTIAVAGMLNNWRRVLNTPPDSPNADWLPSRFSLRFRTYLAAARGE